MSRTRKASAVYSIFVGVSIVGMWAVFLLAGQVPELVTTPIAISFHLAAEFLTALALLLGGYGVLTRRDWGLQVHLVSLGMLLYSLVSEVLGYFGQQGQGSMTAMGGVLTVLTLTFIGLALQKQDA